MSIYRKYTIRALLFQGEASIFHVAMGRATGFSKLTIEQVTAISALDTCRQYQERSTITGLDNFYK